MFSDGFAAIDTLARNSTIEQCHVKKHELRRYIDVNMPSTMEPTHPSQSPADGNKLAILSSQNGVLTLPQQRKVLAQQAFPGSVNDI